MGLKVKREEVLFMSEEGMLGMKARNRGEEMVLIGPRMKSRIIQEAVI